MGQAGIPLFYLQGMGGGAVLKFRDLFNDSSLYWGWRLFLGEVSEVGKSGWETTGRYFLQVVQGADGRWDSDDNEAPRLIIGVLTYPCEIKTRLDTFSDNIDNHAGIYISKCAVGFGADNIFGIGRTRSAIFNGITAYRDGGSVLNEVAITTLPVWLRIRLGCGGYNALNAYFDYSHDGLNWTNLAVQNTTWFYMSGWNVATGLVVKNFTSANEVIGSFDHFIMRPRSIN